MNFKYKVLRLMCLALCLFVLFSGTAFAQFSDTKGHWAEAKIIDFYEQGFVKGYSDGTFKPEGFVTKAEFVAMVNRFFGYSDEAEIDFKDVKPGDWFYTEVARGIAAGVVSGFSDGTFKPYSTILRQDAAVIVSKILELDTASYPDNLGKFKDSSDTGKEERPYVNSLVSENIMEGLPDGSLKPLKKLTRGEAVKILVDTLKKWEELQKDKIPPIVLGVEDGKTYDRAVTISFDEGTATLDGKAFTSGSSVDGNGSYTLLVTDAEGNTTTVRFTIAIPAPTKLSVGDCTVVKGQMVNAAVVAEPKDAALKFSSAKPDIAAVDADTGVITGVATGSVKITVTAAREGWIKSTADFNVTVTPSDTTPPVVTGVEDGQTYYQDVTIGFDEGTAELNGKKFKSGSVVGTNGNYTLVVTDEEGNKTTVGFTVAKPSIKSISATNGTITVTLDGPADDLAMADFDLKARLDDMVFVPMNLVYNPAQNKFSFVEAAFTDYERILAITLSAAGSSSRLLGSASASVTIPKYVPPTPSPSPLPTPDPDYDGINVLPPVKSMKLGQGASESFDMIVRLAAEAKISMLDVVFAVDVTGSMGGEISTIQKAAVDMMEAIREAHPDSNFGVVSFGDYPGFRGYGSPGDEPYTLEQAVTSDKDAICTAVDRLYAHGGNDGPESYTRMLYEVGDLTPREDFVGWRAGAKKVVIVFGDAPTHDLSFGTGCDPGRDGIADTADDLVFIDVVKMLREEGIIVLAVQSEYSSSATSTFKGMSEGYEDIPGTRGKHFMLGSSSEIPEVVVSLVGDEASIIRNLKVGVPDAYTGWISVSPADGYDDIPLAEASYTFGISVTVPVGTAAGTYTFPLTALADGVNLGACMLTVEVEEAEVLAATLVPTGAEGPHDVLEFRMMFGETVLDLSAAEGRSMTMTHEGTTNNLTLDSEKTLWFNKGRPEGEYIFIFYDGDKVYRAVLNWVPPAEIDRSSLVLTSMPTEEWEADEKSKFRLINKSGRDINFSWEIYGTGMSGGGTVKAEHTEAARFENPFYFYVDAPAASRPTVIVRWGSDGEFSTTKAGSGEIKYDEGAV